MEQHEKRETVDLSFANLVHQFGDCRFQSTNSFPKVSLGVSNVLEAGASFFLEFIQVLSRGRVIYTKLPYIFVEKIPCLLSCLVGSLQQLVLVV